MWLWAGVPLADNTARALAPATPDPTAERVRWRALLNWPERCEADHQATLAALGLNDSRVQVYDLEANRRLIVVGCAQGAYQSTWRYHLLDESVSPPKALALAVLTWQLDDEDVWQPLEAQELAGAPSFDARARVLTILTRARGLGDCGLRVRYRVQGDRLNVLEARGRACDGDPEQAAPPERWPALPTGAASPAPVRP